MLTLAEKATALVAIIAAVGVLVVMNVWLALVGTVTAVPLGYAVTRA
ncbi:hypothetical protein [Halosegnis marinus]|uniref:Uncharacterized protein n=1 Tax=Halosegnis marinus TaxID=3034023 RepID=A0ABD5ZJY6_9EURY|nr:hypothetical protein [Halosegnis sp. DT85]